MVIEKKEEKFKEVNNIDDLVFIYNKQVRSEFERRLNEYITKINVLQFSRENPQYIGFWETLKEVVDKAGIDYYNYKKLISERLSI